MMNLDKYYPLILETLTEDTLSVFSQFAPYSYTMDVNLNDQTPVRAPNGGDIYYLKNAFLDKHGIEVISIEDVMGSDSFTDWNEQPATFNVEDIILYGAASNIRSQLNLSSKGFEFVSPNRVRLLGYRGYETVKMTVKIPYPNFGAVAQSFSIALEELAILDVKIVLYAELKHYQNLDTADGQIDLKIDDWADAYDKRLELLADWRNKAITNQTSRPYTYE
jgi:hypothetical protein